MEKDKTMDFPFRELIAFLEERGFSVTGIKVESYPVGIPSMPHIDFTVCRSDSTGTVYCIR
jgi:hypothetical protein